MRVLLVRIDGLGDTVLTTPLLRSLHEAGARTTVVASPVGAQCLRGHPGVAQVIEAQPGSSLSEKLRLRRQLRDFDAALVVTEKAWGYLWATGARRRVGFSSGAVQPLKSVVFERLLTDVLPSSHGTDLHEVERILQLAEPLGLSTAGRELWLPHVAVGVEPEDAIAVHLSQKWLTDGYDETWLRSLVTTLATLSPIHLSWGPPDAAWAPRFGDTLRNSGDSFVRCHRIERGAFGEWCEGLRRCKLLVSMDTGAVHVGAALGMRIVDVFGVGGDPRQWRPWGVEHRVVARAARSDEESRRVLAEVVRASQALAQEPNHDL